MKIISAVLLSSISFSAIASCPSQVRFIHGEAFNDSPVEVYANGRLVVSDLAFRGVTAYSKMKPGKISVEFRNKETGETLQKKSFTAGPNLGHTVILAGPATGPEGMRNGNSSPFVMIDDITPPSNPNRWKGTWYRMSETNVVIDFRISQASDPSKEVARLIQKPNRAAYQLGDLPAGTYQFNPVMPGSSETFFNPALVPPRNVELTNVEIGGGEIFDVIALGNFLGKAPNSLDLTSARYTPSVNNKGCISLKQN